MGSISPSLPISLLPWDSAASKPGDILGDAVARINFERHDQNGFRGVTEESLRQEIADEEAGLEDGSSVDEDDDSPDRLKELNAAREEMLQLLGRADYDAGVAQDFLSLLLSKTQPHTAGQTVSEYLKQAVPLGTLGMDKVASSMVTEAQREDEKKVAKGWKIQNLNKAADTILASATRLQKEMEVETKYWEEVLSINDGGWAVCRIPQEKHTLGVRLGFLEGTAAFKNRSLAALRRGQDGNIILDQGVAVVEPKALRVRIYSDGQFASSKVPELLANDAPIESRILQARNTLFSLELWQELARESRTLLSFNVHLREDSITCPFTTGKILVLDLVSLTDNISKSSHPDDALAQAMYLAFNLLLTYSHRESHRRRTKVPPPLDATKEERPTYSLIRPLVTRINHQRALEYTHALMNPLVQALKGSGLAASYSQSTQTTNLDLDISATERTVRSLIDDLEVQTIFNIMPTVAINIISRTKLLPFSNTVYEVTLSPSDCPLLVTCPPPRRFDVDGVIETWKQVEEYVLFATSCALAHHLLISLSSETDSSDDSRWQSTAQPNMVRYRNSITGVTTQVTFRVERIPESVGYSSKPEGVIRWGAVRESTGGKSKGRKTEWFGFGGRKKGVWDDGDGQEVVRTLKDFVSDISRD